jgi:hypothetical protein
MAYPINRQFDEHAVYARTTSMGGTPAAGKTIATKKGRITRAYAYSEGATTGTVSVAIAINGGSSAGSLSFTGGADTFGSGEFNIPVSEGDIISFTPSGATGSTIAGHFYAIIR